MKNYRVLSSGWLESVVLICSSLLSAQLIARDSCPGGGIGRHAGLRSLSSKGGAGSSPVSGTKLSLTLSHIREQPIESKKRFNTELESL